jgi:hypothetical protein
MRKPANIAHTRRREKYPMAIRHKHGDGWSRSTNVMVGSGHATLRSRAQYVSKDMKEKDNGQGKKTVQKQREQKPR